MMPEWYSSAMPKKQVLPLDQADVWIVVDFSNIAWLSLFASGIKDPQTIPENYIAHHQTFIEKMEDVIRNVGQMENSLVFALDSFPKYKLSIDPEYKQNRDPIKFNPKKGLLELFSKNYSFYTSKVVDQEADDVIATIIHNYQNKQIILVTSDRDLWQLLEYQNCSIFDPLKKEFVNKEWLRKKFKLERFGHIILHKSLWGDRGDNVMNALPRMQRHALPILNSMDEISLASFFNNFESEIPNMSKSKKTRENIKKKFEEAKEQIAVNHSLVCLNKCLDISFEKYD